MENRKDSLGARQTGRIVVESSRRPLQWLGSVVHAVQGSRA